MRLIKTRAATETTGQQMCDGKSLAWSVREGLKNKEHEAYQPHQPCPRCHAKMGCVRCSGPANELFCNNCHDYVGAAAIKQHGRLLNAPQARSAAISFIKGTLKSLGGRGIGRKDV